jgi:lysophosphatidic acid acyltransferase/lysophosphatidylinositol acyltransferase
LLFCEGTRFTKSKHEQSLKIAKEKGLPQLKHHLLPRTKGFSLLARGARQRNFFFQNPIEAKKRFCSNFMNIKSS